MNRWVYGYAYWGGVWLLLGFLAAEILGYMNVAPWPTLSETVWHSDSTYPIVATLLFGTFIGLMAHFFYHRGLLVSLLYGVFVSGIAHLIDKHMP